jgi:hypothetical protein
MVRSDGDSRLAVVEHPDWSAAKNKTLLFWMKTGFCKRLIIGSLFLQVLR